MSEKDEDKDVETIFAVLLLVTLPFAMVWEGYVGSVLWNWHVAPVVGHRLGVAAAVGVSCVFGLWSPTVPKKDQRTAFLWLTLIFRPAFYLLLGWLALKFGP